eukprot:COSAG02_NODE_7174_length_3137_cov_20.762673_2_plen_179_part_00
MCVADPTAWAAGVNGGRFESERVVASCCTQGQQSGDGEEGVVFKALTAQQMKKVREQHKRVESSTCSALAEARVRRAQGKSETRKVLVPPHRYTPLKENWELIYEPLVEQMGLQVRMNVKKRTVELRVRVRSLRFLLSVAAALSSTDWLSAGTDLFPHRRSWSVSEGCRLRQGLRARL